MCIIMGAAADSIVKANRGRKITAAEVYEILRKAEDDGLVHQVTNMEGAGSVQKNFGYVGVLTTRHTQSWR